MSALMDELLAEAHGLQGKSVVMSSRRMYESRMRVYTSCCNNDLHIDLLEAGPCPLSFAELPADWNHD